jgi:hypothetical protein
MDIKKVTPTLTLELWTNEKAAYRAESGRGILN